MVQCSMERVIIRESGHVMSCLIGNWPFGYQTSNKKPNQTSVGPCNKGPSIFSSRRTRRSAMSLPWLMTILVRGTCRPCCVFRAVQGGVLMTCLTQTQHTRDPTGDRRRTAGSAKAVGSYRKWLLLGLRAHRPHGHGHSIVGDWEIRGKSG